VAKSRIQRERMEDDDGKSVPAQKVLELAMSRSYGMYIERKLREEHKSDKEYSYQKEKL